MDLMIKRKRRKRKKKKGKEKMEKWNKRKKDTIRVRRKEEYSGINRK